MRGLFLFLAGSFPIYGRYLDCGRKVAYSIRLQSDAQIHVS